MLTAEDDAMRALDVPERLQLHLARRKKAGSGGARSALPPTREEA